MGKLGGGLHGLKDGPCSHLKIAVQNKFVMQFLHSWGSVRCSITTGEASTLKRQVVPCLVGGRQAGRHMEDAAYIQLISLSTGEVFWCSDLKGTENISFIRCGYKDVFTPTC